MGRLLTFNSVDSAHQWFEQMQGCFLKELGLDSIRQDDIVGPHADILWSKYNAFITMTFEEWLWRNIKDKEEQNLKLKKTNNSIAIQHEKLKKANDEISSSISYRVGLFITFPIRFVFNLIRSWR